MNDRTKTGLGIIQVAAVAGILGDILLRQTPWGLNVFLFNLAFVAGTATLMLRRNSKLLNAQSLALLGAQLFFAAMFVLRDSIELRVADTFAIVTILSVLFVPRMKIAANVAGVFQYVIGFFWSSLNAFFSPFILLASDIEWKAQSGWSKHLVSVLRGLVIATPIVLVFGGLFVAADAVYQGMVQRIFNIDPEVIFSHVLLITFFSWMSAGYLRGIMFGNEPVLTADPIITPQTAQAETRPSGSVSNVDRIKNEAAAERDPFLPNFRTVLEHINTSDPPDPEDSQAETRPVGSVSNAEAPGSARASQTDPNAEARASARAENGPEDSKKTWSWANIDNSLFPAGLTLGSVEIGVIFGAIDLLFLSFVIVQIPYLFGGMDLVQNTPDFKLAEYARRGFGELVTVSALVLPILLAAHWLIRKDNPFTEKLFRVLAGVQLVLLFVIMASAVQRLVLLTGNVGYGLTTVRLYPMIFMTWLAIVFIWFSLTVLRGARQYFAWGALWSAIFVLGSTHFLNPDKFIVQTNIALMKQGREFDAYYNSHLSDDALPTVTESFTDLSSNDQKTVIRALAERYCLKTEESDLRSWNFARMNASRSLASAAPAVETLGGCRDGHLASYPAFRIDD